MFTQAETLPTDSADPMILFWVITFIFCLIVLMTDAKLLSKKVKTTLSLITIILAGFLLKGIPNVLVPIEYALIIISEKRDIIHILHPIAIFSFIMGTSFIVGRIFCGYACPIGSLQEIISTINFKSDLKAQKENKYHVDISSQISNKVRWIFTGCLFFLAIFFEIAILRAFNPLSGFTLALLIPIISLLIACFASIFVYRPWCRFLCPFGAGSSFLAKSATVTYRRTMDCNDCGFCEKICPTKFFPGECYYCNRCVEICPKDAIKFSLLY
jgi:polyferredoxin